MLRRRGLIAVVAAAGLLGVGVSVGPAGAAPAADTRGYEIVTPNGTRLCMQMSDHLRLWVTPYCNYHSPAQRFTASRGGGWTYLKNNNGTCFDTGWGNVSGGGGPVPEVTADSCSGTKALWKRTTTSEWTSHDAPGTCLFGSYTPPGPNRVALGVLQLRTCASVYNQRWQPTG